MKLADISKYQGNIKFDNLNVDALIIRAGYRGYSNGVIVTDNKLTRNIQGRKEYRIPFGLYFYSQAINESERIVEAQFLIGKAARHNVMFLRLDMELSGSGMGRADHLPAETRQKIADAFRKTVKEAGYLAVIYSNENYFVQNLNTRSPHYINWVRNWSKEPLIDYRIWQYTNHGRVEGIDYEVDLNRTDWTYNDFTGMDDTYILFKKISDSLKNVSDLVTELEKKVA